MNEINKPQKDNTLVELDKLIMSGMSINSSPCKSC